MKERIQKVLANYGVDSRRNIEQMILQGRVSVNGEVVTKLPILIDPEKDHVEVDDEKIRLATNRKGDAPVPRLYFLLNKPRDVYSTNVAQGEQRLAKDLLPPDLPGRVYPVGRLDADSKGLLILTNDGELTNLLTHPRYEVPKTYRATIDGLVTDETLAAMRAGVWLADKSGKAFKTGTARMKVIHRTARQTVVEVTIREGRNRQVRRVFAKFGHKVRELMRIKFGPLDLTGLGPGKFRELTPKEVKALYALAKEGERRAAKAGGAKKAPTKRGPAKKFEKADPQNMGVEFEDEELRREAAAERGEAVEDQVEFEEDELELEDGDEAEVEFMMEDGEDEVEGGEDAKKDDELPE